MQALEVPWGTIPMPKTKIQKAKKAAKGRVKRAKVTKGSPKPTVVYETRKGKVGGKKKKSTKVTARKADTPSRKKKVKKSPTRGEAKTRKEKVSKSRATKKKVPKSTAKKSTAKTTKTFVSGKGSTAKTMKTFFSGKGSTAKSIGQSRKRAGKNVGKGTLSSRKARTEALQAIKAEGGKLSPKEKQQLKVRKLDKKIAEMGKGVKIGGGPSSKKKPKPKPKPKSRPVVASPSRSPKSRKTRKSTGVASNKGASSTKAKTPKPNPKPQNQKKKAKERETMVKKLKVRASHLVQQGRMREVPGGPTLPKKKKMRRMDTKTTIPRKNKDKK